jgi:hypothetical protein
MADLENDELNHQLCAVAADEMFESWSPETQEQILSEWNDWRRDRIPGHSCDECGKTFTRSNDLKRHTKRVHTWRDAKKCVVSKFRLIVFEHARMAYFRNNTVANFRVKLAETIVLPGQWEVALTELYYPRT